LKIKIKELAPIYNDTENKPRDAQRQAMWCLIISIGYKKMLFISYWFY